MRSQDALRAERISAGGAQHATPRDASRVATRLAFHVGPQNAVRAADLALLSGVEGRTTRASYAALDGSAFVLGKNGVGLYVAETPEQAEALDKELLSKLRAIAARLRARKAFWKRQSEIKQIPMFGEVA